MIDIRELLDKVIDMGGSDLHLLVGEPPTIRLRGGLTRLNDYGDLTPEQTDSLMRQVAPKRAKEELREVQGADFGFGYKDKARFRVSIFMQKGTVAMNMRLIPYELLSFEQIGIPTSIVKLLHQPRGLILVVGPTGSGKTTTLATMLNYINENRECHIITIEDPIEYYHNHKTSVVIQREVGVDVTSFDEALVRALRQDPDVILVGEMRDLATMEAAITAAETGHLVLTTLHADSVAQAIARIREYTPAAEQDSVSALLARNTNAIICQRLLPNVQGTRTPCLEVMRRNRGAQEAIANNQLELLSGIVETAVNEGMHTFDQYLTELLAAGVVTQQTALEYAVNRHRLDMALRGFASATPILRRDEDR